MGFIIRIKKSFIARYVYTYEEFDLVTEAPQCNRMTATGQDTDNTKIKDNIQNRHFRMYRYVRCKFEIIK